MNKPSRRGPQRTCTACRKILDQSLLVRYVLSPHGEILVDYGRKLPGRGVYTCCDTDCLEKAVRSRQFERVFKGRVSITDAKGLQQSLVEQIQQRVANLLGMARKSGDIVSGSRLVLAELGRVPGLSLVLLSEDLSPTIAAKIRYAAEARGISCYVLFDKERMGQLLGKGERSVVALRCGLLAETISHEILRYKRIAGEA